MKLWNRVSVQLNGMSLGFWEWGPAEWNDMLADAQPSQQNLDHHDSNF